MRAAVAMVLLVGGIVTTPAHAGPLPPVDPIVCPLLASAFPPEGDVGGVWDCPPYGNGGGGPEVGVVASALLTIVGGDGVAPQYVPPAGFLCSSTDEAGQYAVTCSQPSFAPGRRSSDGVRCVQVSVAVQSQSSSSGSISGSTHCGNAQATATVNTPPAGSASATTNTDQMVNSWACVTVESGNPRPWHVRCSMSYYA